MRDLRSFFATTFKILPVPSTHASAADSDDDDDEEEDQPVLNKGREYVLSCMGTGHTNTNKSVT